MKIGRVEIGAGVTVGSSSTILYDTHVGDGAVLGPLTLVAKGERLPPDTALGGLAGRRGQSLIAGNQVGRNKLA